MRKVLFSLIFLLAAFIPASLHAGHAISETSNKISIHDIIPHFYQSDTESILINDILEDTTDDSNSNESDRKKTSSAKSTVHENFHAGNSHDFRPVKTCSSHISVVQKTSRYVLLSVFRL